MKPTPHSCFHVQIFNVTHASQFLTMSIPHDMRLFSSFFFNYYFHLVFFLLPTEIMRSNGFCLANTETIVIDHSIPNGKEKHLDVDAAEHL